MIFFTSYYCLLFDCVDGSLRVDANVSVRRPGTSSLGVRTEIKNVSGFRVLTKAIGKFLTRTLITAYCWLSRSIYILLHVCLSWMLVDNE